MSTNAVLVVGATGQTGRRLVAELLARGVPVRAIVRSRERVPNELRDQPGLTLLEGSALEMDSRALADAVAGCGAIASCLGHNLTFRGMFGRPRRLVRDSIARLCEAVRAGRPDEPVRVVLMCSSGVRNGDLDEPVSVPQHVVLFLLRHLLPPHADNEAAAAYLRTEIGRSDPALEWAVVRPDTLEDREEVTEYELHPSPVRSAIFNAGRTSRINVAHCLARLATDETDWARWRFAMPVIYNREDESRRDDSDRQSNQEGTR